MTLLKALPRRGSWPALLAGFLFFGRLCLGQPSLDPIQAGNAAVQTAGALFSLTQNQYSFEKVPPDPLSSHAICDYVNAVGAKLFAVLPTQTQYPVYLLKTAQVQGFTNPDGIYISRGMLNSLQNEAQLAFLLGHEIGHLQLGHVTASNPNTADPSALAVAQAAGAGASSLNEHFLKISEANFSQRLEEEADEYGLLLAAKAGYDPAAGPQVFSQFAKQWEHWYSGFSHLESGHKTFGERAQHLQKVLAEQGYRTGQGLQNREAYQNALAALAEMHTGEGPAPGAPMVQDSSPSELDDLLQHLQQEKQSGRRLSKEEFLKTMQKLSALAQRQHWQWKDLEAPQGAGAGANKPGEKNFMDDLVFQDAPIWGNHQAPEAPAAQDNSFKLRQALGLVGELALGLEAPEVLIPVMAYQAISGKDFLSGQSLSTGGRVVSAVGALLPVIGRISELFESASASDEQFGQVLQQAKTLVKKTPKVKVVENENKLILKNDPLR